LVINWKLRRISITSFSSAGLIVTLEGCWVCTGAPGLKAGVGVVMPDVGGLLKKFVDVVVEAVVVAPVESGPEGGFAKKEFVVWA